MSWFDKKWFKYIDDKEGFEVLFPKKPAVNKADGMLSGTYTKIIKYFSSGNLDMYMVSITKIQEYAGAPVDFLHSALDMFQNDIDDSRIAQVKTRKFNSYPALEFILSVGEQRNGRGIFFLKENKLFNITAILYNDSADSSDRISKFIDSFGLDK